MDGDKSARGNAGQYFVAGELSRRGYAAAITLGNTPNTDILCSDRGGTRFVHIQVKTFIPGTKTCSVGLKATRSYDASFFWVRAGVPVPGSASAFEYFVIPASVISEQVAAYHARWLAAPGKGDRARKDSAVRAVGISEDASPSFWYAGDYKDRWDLIGDRLTVGASRSR